MVDSFATVYDDLRLIEAAMERTINDEPLLDENVPPIAQSHANISIAVDAMGPFTIHLQQQQQQQQMLMLLPR
jgi:hypothetical protein